MSYTQNNPLSRKNSKWGGNKDDYKRRDIGGVEKKIGDVGGHYKDYEGVSRQPSGGNKGDEKKSVRDYEGPSRQPYGGNEGDESRSKRDYEGMARKSSSPLNNAGNIYGGWKSSRELTDMPIEDDMHKGMSRKSPLNYGKGCAETDAGCIREGSGSKPFYILNNIKGGVWTEGGRFATKEAAKDKLAAMHINK